MKNLSIALFLIFSTQIFSSDCISLTRDQAARAIYEILENSGEFEVIQDDLTLLKKSISTIKVVMANIEKDEVSIVINDEVLNLNQVFVEQKLLSEVVQCF